MKGFNRYKSLVGVHYVESETKEESPKKEVENPVDRVMDLIFARDKNGFPNSSVEVLLSPKTSDEVRSFIQNNILTTRQESHVFDSPEIAYEFRQLSSEFIAQASRNRFESIEDYEDRLHGLIVDYEKKETFKSFHERMKKLNDSK